MKKLLVLLFLFCAIFAGAQSVPTTPNYGFYIPLHGTANWDTYMNSNFTSIDTLLSGGSNLQKLNIGQIMLSQYLDYTGLSSPPANPATGICRTYFDLASGSWKGINSTGANCSPTGNNSGTTGAVAFYATTGTVLSPSLCIVDTSGVLTCASFITNGIGTAKIDFPVGASPGNPATGLRLFANNATSKFTCIDSTGADCFNVNWGDIGGTLSNQTDLNTALGLKAPLASPTFTGTPLAPTAAPGTNTTQLATTAFVATSFAPLASPTFTGTVTAPKYATTTNCASSGGTCAAAPAGMVSIAAAATTVTVSTTAVTANSEIMVQEDSTLGTALSVTCNTTTGRTYTITTRTAGTSFVVTASAAPTTNPACLSYRIIN